MELDNQTLDEILSGRSPYLEQHCDGALWLMLGSFSHAADEVLERLAAGTQKLEGIELGIIQLSPRAAKILLGMNVDFLFLSGLRGLDEQAAFVLGAYPFDARPIRQLRLEEPISERAAAWLVGEPPPENGCDRPLTVSVPSITLPVAQALSRHTHELYLEVRGEMLSPDVAAALAEHKGYYLELWLSDKISDEARRQFSITRGKRVGIKNEGATVYLVNHDMWCSGYEEHLPLSDDGVFGTCIEERRIKQPAEGGVLLGRHVAIALEATGLSPEVGNRVIELGMVEVVDGRPSGRMLHAYFDPERYIEPGAQMVHGIDDIWLEGMPHFEQLAGQVMNFVSDAHLMVIRNPFALSLLDAEMERLGFPLVSASCKSVTEVWVTAKRLWPDEKCDFASILSRLGLPSTEARDALMLARQIVTVSQHLRAMQRTRG